MYDDFVRRFVDVAKAYKLGDPTKPETTLGPVVSLASAKRIRKQVNDAGEVFLASWFCTLSQWTSLVAAGAQVLLDESSFPEAKEGSTLVGPQVLVNVDHSELASTQIRH